MNYWLFQGNPKYCKIIEAIKNLDEMPWPVSRYGKEMLVGDGVLVWVSGKEGGIYAIAEIIEPPQMLTEFPDIEYWIDSSRVAGKPHALIGFIRKLVGQPLRRHELQQDAILKNLLVIRAPNSTNFKVTSPEWERVHQLKG